MAMAAAVWKRGPHRSCGERPAARLLTFLAVLACAHVGCSQYRPFDTEADLRQRFEARLGAE
ncbi:MAG: hypothetical protein HC897_12600, partial [Thermoanaerobaculia bacterium]|nr:hypothetical protein [Thermoanaerobaculia bacterium]